jgi:uncharacterized protein
MDNEVRDNPAMRRFEMLLGGETVAVACNKVDNGQIVLRHTEVPQELSGQGYGSSPAHGVFEMPRRNGRRVVVKCHSSHHMQCVILNTPRY